MSSPDQIVNAMSVDVEDYYQVSAFDRVVSRAKWGSFDSRVVRNTERLLELFDRHGARATFFVLGWTAERFPSLVRHIASRGHEVASHGYDHQLIYTLTPEQFRTDVRAAKATLEDSVGTAVLGYRAPSFSVIESTLWAIDVLIEEGYQYDASVFPIRHDRYGIPDAPRHSYRIDRPAGTLIEIPASTVRVARMNMPIAGGGYFRLSPYSWTRWGIRRVNRAERAPVVFYLHPWEIDPEQPRLAVGATTRLRHYVGLDRTIDRLSRLLTDFRFDSIASILKMAPSTSNVALGPADPVVALAAPR
jgi:polysaccharide deacetylase family protein (PEP-CTERM system associated)